MGSSNEKKYFVLTFSIDVKDIKTEMRVEKAVLFSGNSAVRKILFKGGSLAAAAAPPKPVLLGPDRGYNHPLGQSVTPDKMCLFTRHSQESASRSRPASTNGTTSALARAGHFGLRLP